MPDIKIFDKAGSPWILDKKSKKLKKIIKSFVENDKYYKYNVNDIVIYDNGFKIGYAKIIDVIDGDNYKIEFENEKIIVPKDYLFNFEEE